MRYISEVSDSFEYQLGAFNVIASGTGTGKTVYVKEKLMSDFPEIKPSEVLYVTSRAMVCDQQAQKDGIARFRISTPHDDSIAGVWNGESGDTIDEQNDRNIWIMNYSQLADYLDKPRIDKDGAFVFKNIKLIIFDECHSLYVDNFISKMSLVRCWVRERIWAEKTYVIGLTATPNIMRYYANMASMRIRIVNENNYLVNFKAKKLICAKYADLLNLLDDSRLPGRTIMLISTVEEGLRFESLVDNAFFLCSKSHRKHTEEMDAVREYIIHNETIPEYLSDAAKWITKGGKQDRKIDVLITTSTMREGLNIRESSGVKNVISCMADDIHVIQFMGRCRYSIENVIVAGYTFNGDFNGDYREYIRDERRLFYEMVEYQKGCDRNDHPWYDTIAPFIEGDFDDVELYSAGGAMKAFWNYIDSTISINDGVYILKGSEEKNQFVDIAKKFGILDIPKSKYTFQKVKRAIEVSDDFVIEHKYSAKADGSKDCYYMITRRSK